MLIILWCFISSFYEYQQGDHENDHDDGHGNVDNDHVIGPPGSSGFFLFFFHQAPLVHLEKLLFWKLGLAKLPSVRRIKTE